MFFRKHALKFRLASITLVPLIAVFIVSFYDHEKMSQAVDEIEAIAQTQIPNLANSAMKNSQSSIDAIHRFDDFAADLQESVIKVEDLEESALINSSMLTLSTLLIALFLNLIISRKIISSFRKASTIAKKISDGERDIEIQVESEDEIGTLLHSLQDMQENINHVEQALKDREHQIKLITDSVPAMICYVDKDRIYKFCNLKYADFFNKTKEEIVGKDVMDVMDDNMYYKVSDKIITVLSGKKVEFNHEYAKEGSIYYSSIQYVPDFDELGECVGYIAVMHDITKLKQNEFVLEQQRRELEHASNTDALTGVHNRRFLMEKMDEEIVRSKRYKTPLSVMMLDLDHFKKINDTHGHNAGDHVLKIIGKVLKHNVRETDIISRFGGEEFNIILPNSDLAAADIVAERLRAVIEEAHIPIDKDNRIDFTCSIGVAEYNSSIRNAETLLAVSDEALYRAKKLGRNRVVNAQELVPALTADKTEESQEVK